jgi:hypothetical protein
MLTDYRYGLRWRDVVARDAVVVALGVKIFLDELFPPRESVSSAHVPIMADRRCTPTSMLLVRFPADASWSSV